MAQSGEAAPVADVALPDCVVSPEDVPATSCLLFVADFLAQFSKVLKIKSPPAFETLMEFLEASEMTDKEEQIEALAELYESLLEITLKVNSTRKLSRQLNQSLPHSMHMKGK